MKLRTCKRNAAALIARARKGLLHASHCAADAMRDAIRTRSALRAKLGNAQHYPGASPDHRTDTPLLDAL